MSDNDILCSFIQQDENGGYRTKGKTEEEIKFWEEKTCDAIPVSYTHLPYTSVMGKVALIVILCLQTGRSKY